MLPRVGWEFYSVHLQETKLTGKVELIGRHISPLCKERVLLSNAVFAWAVLPLLPGLMVKSPSWSGSCWKCPVTASSTCMCLEFPMNSQPSPLNPAFFTGTQSSCSQTVSLHPSPLPLAVSVSPWLSNFPALFILQIFNEAGWITLNSSGSAREECWSLSILEGWLKAATYSTVPRDPNSCSSAPQKPKPEFNLTVQCGSLGLQPSHLYPRQQTVEHDNSSVRRLPGVPTPHFYPISLTNS